MIHIQRYILQLQIPLYCWVYLGRFLTTCEGRYYFKVILDNFRFKRNPDQANLPLYEQSCFKIIAEWILTFNRTLMRIADRTMISRKPLII